MADQTELAYRIGEIPDFTIWEDRTKTFRILTPESKAKTTYSISADPTPNGQIGIGDSGLFSYKPTQTDLFPFSVRFRTSGDTEESQTISITPLPRLRPETDLIENVADAPADEDYVVRSTFVNKQVGVNHLPPPAREISISGYRLRLDSAKGEEERKLFALLNFDPAEKSNADIASVLMAADSITIAGHLHIPGANVEIFARELIFEDQGGATSAIDTTPLDFLASAADSDGTHPGTDGQQGTPGGSIRLHIEKLAPATPAVRFIARGGKGQNPGRGAPGAAGANMQSWPVSGPGATYTAVYEVIFYPVGPSVRGTQAWPGDGGAGIRAGRPGDGGPGGTVFTTLAGLAAYVDVRGGPSGDVGSAAPGGSPGAPSPAYWIAHQYQLLGGAGVVLPPTVQSGPHMAQQGPTTPPPGPNKPAGDPGAYQVYTSDKSGWLHPLGVAASLAYVRDAYIAGRTELAQSTLSVYRQEIDTGRYTDSPEMEIFSARADIGGLMHQISSNLDYFGNPAGWVPLLSLQANLAAYKGEIEASIPLLYLSFWLEHVAEKLQLDQQALRDSITTLSRDTDARLALIPQVSNLLQNLTAEAQQVADDIRETDEAIAAKQQELEKRALTDEEAAKSRPFWTQALGVVSTACKLIPVYQPALGAVGVGLDLLVNLGQKSPGDVVAGVAEMTENLTADSFKKSQESLTKALSQLDPKNSASAGEYVKNIVQTANEFRPAVDAIANAIRGTSISDSDVRAELQYLEAQDTEFQGLVEKVKALLTSKERLFTAQATAIHQIEEVRSSITQNLSAIATYNRRLGGEALEVNYTTLARFRRMKEDARRRLLKYAYYTAKCFQYRLLRPYPASLDLSSIEKQILELVKDQPYALSQAIKGIRDAYVGNLRAVVDAATEEWEKNQKGSTLDYEFELDASERKALTDNQSVTIDLETKVSPGKFSDNRRIAELDFLAGKAKVSVNGPIPENARLQFLLEHPPISVVESSGRRFSFRFGTLDDTRPFSWSAVYDLNADNLVSAQSSDTDLAALKSLLGISDTDLFNQPSVDTNLSLSLDKKPTELKAEIASLGFHIKIQASTTKKDIFRVSTRTGDSLPIVTVDPPDISGRTTGRGSFTRVYEAGTKGVTIRVQEVLGRYKFQCWQSPSGEVLTQSPVLHLDLSRDWMIIPIFSPPL